MFDFQQLYESHLRCRKGHRYKNEVILFETRLIENLLRIERELKYLETYNIKYYSFEIMEPQKRGIHATPYEYRNVIACLSDRIIKRRMTCLFFCSQNKTKQIRIKTLKSKAHFCALLFNGKLIQ